jgi:putative tryptophan/tyrosine transport system substrate-binding protein
VSFRRLGTVVALVLGTLAWPLVSESQRPENVPRIGYLILSPLADPPSAERQAFLDGLRDLGYVVGRNIIIDYRSAAWNRELLPDLAAELVERKVDVILAVPGTVDAARQATRTIPIVIPGGSDPVESGLVTSFARPGGNITGTTLSLPEMAGKRLDLLKEAFPKLSRLAIIWNPANDGAQLDWQQTQAAARTLGLALESFEVRDPQDFSRAFSAMTRKRPDALVTLMSVLTSAYRPIIVEFATKQRLPTMFALRADVKAGGLMSYAASVTDLFRRTAYYVDRILKGAKPADLPIEQPVKFELVINLKTAKALGVTIPRPFLLRADQIIE